MVTVRFASETLKGWSGALHVSTGTFYCSTSKRFNNGNERSGREKFFLSMCRSVPEDTQASLHTQSYRALERVKTEQAEDFASKIVLFLEGKVG